MEQQRINDWQKAVDTSEQLPLTFGLPADAPLGEEFLQPTDDGPFRRWRRLLIVGGNVGARWAYWAKETEFKIVVDSIFNGDAAHFIGMLGVPYTGKIPGVDTPVWVLISPRMIPPPEPRVYEEKQDERYERSREIYDVSTHTVKKI